MNGGPDEFKAQLVGFDADKDIAVLKISVPDNSVSAPASTGCVASVSCFPAIQHFSMAYFIGSYFVYAYTFYI